MMTVWKITVAVPGSLATQTKTVESKTKYLPKTYHIQGQVQKDAEERAMKLWREELRPEVETQEIVIDATVNQE